MKKNEGGQVVAFQAVSSTDGSAVTTGSPTVYVTIDGGTQATGTNTAIHEGQGSWSYVPTQAETDGDHVVYTFTLAGCINQSVNVYPVVVSEYQATGFSTFNAATDTVANVGTVATCTTNSDMRGTDGANTVTPPASADIADAVWDELSSEHSIAGSFGVYVDSQLSTIRTVVDDTANDITTIQSTLGGSPGVVLTPAQENQIIDGVLDEALASHTTAGSLGKAIADIEVDTNDLQTKIIPMLEVDGSGGYQYTTLSLENAPSGGGGSGPTADEIADAVWDEAIGDHSTVGSFGAGVRVDQSNAESVIGPAVWDVLYTGYTGTDLNFGTLSFQQATVTNSVDTKVDDIQGATFDTATDSLEAIRDRGDAAWVTGGGGGGIWQLTVTVTDTSANAVQGARVAVDGTSLTVTTDTSGEAVLNLNDGSYTLNISSPSGYDDPAPQSITISGADATLGVAVSPTSGSGSCEIPPL